jgi:hypothetical protein
MLGFGEKHDQKSIDPTTLPVFVHALNSTEAFELAQKVWQNNGRYVLSDPGNHKELLPFVFSDPACIVWLGRDKGRTDTFEMILLWDEKGDKQDLTEVYILTVGATTGDDSRVKDLLNAILASPSIVPVNANKP